MAVIYTAPDIMNDICAYLHNYFIADVRTGTFSVVNGVIVGLENIVKPDQYFYLSGTMLSDGIYKRTEKMKFRDETFTGEIMALAIPAPLRAIADEISKWREENETGGYASESFGGYSYQMPTGEDGQPITWREAFAARLRPWRKL